MNVTLLALETPVKSRYCNYIYQYSAQEVRWVGWLVSTETQITILSLCHSSLLNISRFNHNYIFLVPVLMMYWSSASLLFLTMEQIFISLNSIHALSVPSVCSASISLAQSFLLSWDRRQCSVFSDTIRPEKWILSQTDIASALQKT